MKNNLMQSPIFIIGNPRSGTTLLRLMLNSHKDILIPPECGFAIWWHDKYRNWDLNPADNIILSSFLDDLKSSRKIEFWNLDYNELKKFIIFKQPVSYTDLVSTIYEFYGKSRGRKFKRWGDKNNFYLRHIDLIKQLFPQVYFIHIIRDGRDVACSYIRLNKKNIISKYAPIFPKKLREIALEWTSNILCIRRSFNILNWQNVLEVKYEDLVSTPYLELKKICSFLKQPFHRSMIDYYKSAEKQGNEPKDFLQWKEKILRRPTNREVGRYKKELSLKELNSFNSIAEEILKIYKYKL